MPFIYIRAHKLQTLFYVSATIVMMFLVILLIWSMATMGPQGFGETITMSDGHTSGWTIAFGVSSTVGAISANLLNQNDYARFARKPRDAIQGQAIVFSPYSIFCCVGGILVTAATERRYGQAYWNLPDLFGAMIESGGPRSRCAAFFGGFALIISQIGITVPGAALSGGKPHFLVSLKVSVSYYWWASRFWSRGNSPQIYQYSPRGVHNSLSFHSLQSLETCKLIDGLPFNYGRLYGISGSYDWPHDCFLYHHPSVQAQGGWSLRWKRLEYILVFIWSQLACACGLGFGYLPVVTRIHCQCQPKSWSSRGLVPYLLDIFLHRRGHKFCCVRLVTLSLSCPVSPGVGCFTAICSRDYALLQRGVWPEGRYWGYRRRSQW